MIDHRKGMPMLQNVTNPVVAADPSSGNSPFSELLIAIALTVGYMMGAKDYWPHHDEPFPRAH
jgi:hypothetical protein